jgi:hypothetical protein
MGRAAIGGLITSTLLTLFVVPVVYTLLDDVTNRLFHRGATKPAHRAPVAAPRPEPLRCLIQSQQPCRAFTPFLFSAPPQAIS